MNQRARRADIARPGLIQKNTCRYAAVLPPASLEIGYAGTDA